MSSHLKDIVVERYLDGNLPFWRRFLLERHLKKCQECRELLEEIKHRRDYLEHIGQALGRIEKAKDEISHSVVMTKCESTIAEVFSKKESMEQ